MFSHIIWTTYLVLPPQDKRGAWQPLSKMYKNLEENTDINFSKGLHLEYKNLLPQTVKTLSSQDQKVIHDGILELSRENGDRVAGGLKLQAFAVTNTEVHLLIEGSLIESKQKISRLKSRSATLLGFSRNKFDEPSENTWSKGLWAAEFDDENVFITVKKFIDAKNV